MTDQPMQPSEPAASSFVALGAPDRARTTMHESRLSWLSRTWGSLQGAGSLAALLL